MASKVSQTRLPLEPEGRNTEREKWLFEIRNLLVLIESAIHVIGAPFLAGFKYPTNLLSTVARIFFIDIQLDSTIYIYIYSATLFYIFVCSSISFIPTSKLLVILPSAPVKIGSDETSGENLVAGHYLIQCMSHTHIALGVISIVTTILFLISTVRFIKYRHSPVEYAKRDFITMYDYKNTHYAIFQLVQNVIYGIALGFSSYIPSVIVASIFLFLVVTSAAYVFAYEPFYDKRMFMISIGINCTALVTMLLAFAIIFTDDSQASSVMNLHILLLIAFPLGAWIASKFRRYKSNYNLRQVVLSNSTLLDLSRRFLGDEKFFFQLFLPWLMSNRTVEDLRLKWNEIDEPKFVCLAAAIMKNPTLKRLDLSYNRINLASNEGARDCLVGLLQVNTTLQTLIIDKNILGDETAEALCIGLAQNKSVTSLHLTNCRLTSKTGDHFQHLLRHNTTIQEIDLSWNILGPLGVSALASGLKDNTTLKKLDLTWNRFGDKGYEALQDAMTVNKTIEFLGVISNDLSVEQKRKLSELTKKNARRESASPAVTLDPDKLLKMAGGEPVLQKVVDNFYYKIVNDSNIKHYFANITIDRMQHLQFNFLLNFLFNMRSYRGRDMKMAHSRLKISNNDFDAVLHHFTSALEEVLPQLDKNVKMMLAEKLEGLREDIVATRSSENQDIKEDVQGSGIKSKKEGLKVSSISRIMASSSDMPVRNGSGDIDLEKGQSATELDPPLRCPFSMCSSTPTQTHKTTDVEKLVAEMWKQYKKSKTLARYFNDPESRMKEMFVTLLTALIENPEKSLSALPQHLRTSEVAAFHAKYKLSEPKFVEFIHLTSIATNNVNLGKNEKIAIIEGLKKYKSALCPMH
ncbi:hypothetical protein BKA69DRAFT_1035347 [Paraphysoderma sedebokerense]|nr:hypothetical protein BKA69DRAFT_1035347 [Paraphysoderma sedebokerense]